MMKTTFFKKSRQDPELTALRSELQSAQGDLSLAYRQFDQAVELNEQGTVGMDAVPTQEAGRLYGDEKAASPKGEVARRRILTDGGFSKPAEALYQEYLRQMQATAQKDILHNLAVTMLRNGVMPDSDVLAAMGISQEEASVLMRVYQSGSEREELDRVYRRETGEELKRLYKQMLASEESGGDGSGSGQDR